MNITHALVLVPIVVALTLSGCEKSSGSSGAPPIQHDPNPNPPIQPAPNLRPTNSPDVVIISVSGHEDFITFDPQNNTAYLGRSGGAAEMVENLFWRLGNTTACFHFTSSLYSSQRTASGHYGRRGFLGLLDTLFAIKATWIDGYDNPTRIVIIAHSHGCVWAHMATNLLPDVPIEYLISLDGTCWGWPSIHSSDINHYYSNYGNPFPWDIRYPCGNWNIPGLSRLQDIQDVVMPNVGVNLEVRSNSSVFVDTQINHRTNGTRYKIFTFDSIRDNHSMVHSPNGESMPWVLSQLAFLESIKASFLEPLGINDDGWSSQTTRIHPVFPEGNPLEVEVQEVFFEEIRNSGVIEFSTR